MQVNSPFGHAGECVEQRKRVRMAIDGGNVVPFIAFQTDKGKCQ
jgi:hypothetical protein